MGIAVVAFMLLVVVLLFVTIGLQIHGTVLAFKKKWYMGLAALVFPIFAITVSVSKLAFKKDILA